MPTRQDKKNHMLIENKPFVSYLKKSNIIKEPLLALQSLTQFLINGIRDKKVDRECQMW